MRELAEQFFRPFPGPCRYPSATRTLPEQGVYVTEAPSRQAEADDAARRIALLVRKKGFRWRDILVLLRNADAYADIVRRSFEACHIPAFIDRRRSMKNHPLVVLTDALLRFLAAGEKGPWQGWTKELLFQILKTDLLRTFSPEEVDRLENYVLCVGIRRSQWQSVWKFHHPFHLESDNDMPTPQELEELNSMNRCREKLLQFLIPSRTNGALPKPCGTSAPCSTAGSWRRACRTRSPAGMRRPTRRRRSGPTCRCGKSCSFCWTIW